MAQSIVPLIPNANQSLSCTLPIDGKNITLALSITYNDVGGHWYMSISKDGVMLLDAIPLVTGEYPAANLLEQYEHLGIGSAVVVPTSALATGIPDDTNLGTDYVLCWGDTLVS